ncbi:MAG TPA: pseudouridine synthase [Rhodocyclaceae bacterium]|jgi:tRNA pseudouridine32 synthase/23S rRNA pseudouridine746 synthase
MSEFVYRPPPHQGLTVLYVSKQLIILEKPAGLLTVPGRGDDRADCLLSRVQTEFPDAMTVHRLDLATSGIVVMGRGPKYQRELSILFQNRKVSKRYQALVDGQWAPGTEGEVNLPMIVDWPNRPKQKVDHIDGRPSLTRYRVLSTDADTARVDLEPVTGRSHQLRVHMESAGHPILGDDLYGTEESRAKSDRLMLHACFIEFLDPDTGKLISIESKPPF